MKIASYLKGNFRINRNIVECKYKTLTGSLIFCRSINRNIVECKYLSEKHLQYAGKVLIETLWNVNDTTLLNVSTALSLY